MFIGVAGGASQGSVASGGLHCVFVDLVNRLASLDSMFY